MDSIKGVCVWSRLAVTAVVCWSSAGCGPTGFEVITIDDGRDLRAVDIGSDGVGVIAGRQGALHRYGGGTAVVGTYSFETADGRVRTPDLFAASVHLGALWAAGDDGRLVRTQGDELEAEDSGTIRRWLTTVELTPSVLLAGGEQGVVHRRQSGRWRAESPDAPAGSRMTGSWAGGGIAVFTTDVGMVLTRDQRGRWTRETLTTETTTVPIPLFDVWSSTAGADLYVVGLGGAVFRRRAEPPDEAPTAWEQMIAPAAEDLYAIDGTDEGNIYAVGAGGTILRFDGGRWDRAASRTGRDLFGVRVIGNEVVAVGDQRHHRPQSGLTTTPT